MLFNFPFVFAFLPCCVYFQVKHCSLVLKGLCSYNLSVFQEILDFMTSLSWPLQFPRTQSHACEWDSGWFLTSTEVGLYCLFSLLQHCQKMGSGNLLWKNIPWLNQPPRIPLVCTSSLLTYSSDPC